MAQAPTSQFTTGGQISYRWFDNRKMGVIKERVTGTGYSPSLTLTKQIPAGSKLVMASMKNATAVNIRLGSSAAATAGVAAAVLIIGTAPTALTTSLTTANWACIAQQTAFGAAIAANTLAQRPWDTVAVATNGLILGTTLNLPTSVQSTAAKTVYIVPWQGSTTAAEAAQRFQVGTSTAPTVATTGYTFGTSTSDSYSFDVELFFEEFTDPSNS